MKFTITREIKAARQQVWDIMADFGNTAKWNTGLSGSRIVSGPARGVGAERQCDFDGGFLRERITTWRPGEGYDLVFTKFPGPFRAAVQFHLEGEGPTTLRIEYWYQGRHIVRPLGPLIKPMLRKAMRNYARDLAAAAQR